MFIIAATVYLFSMLSNNEFIFNLPEGNYCYIGNGDRSHYNKLMEIPSDNYMKQDRGGPQVIQLPPSPPKLSTPITAAQQNNEDIERIANTIKNYLTKEENFKQIVERINNGTEPFYPKEARDLFGGEYKELVNQLIKNNREILKELLKSDIQKAIQRENVNRDIEESIRRFLRK